MPLDVVVKDGDWLPLAPGLGDWTLQVLETPGHTRDSISLWHRARRSLFVGDLLPGGAGTVVIDPPDGDMRDYLSSLERCAALEPAMLWPAHGSPTGAAVRRIRALIDHRLARERRVLAALGSTPRTPAELVPEAYADTPKELWSWAERSLLAHLEKLAREGRARSDGERWSVGAG
jgi:glyoxylase-like metal-dependent hydrolase (beta-lactamase superfamily II)